MLSAKNLLVISLISLSITGCSLFAERVEPVVIATTPLEKTPLNLEEPGVLKPQNVRWVVITPENADEVFAELRASNTDVVLFGLTDDNYENLSLNLSELRAFLVTQKSIIRAYKAYYEPSENINIK